VGSPRYYQSKFLDASALVRYFHKPDLFITMTSNPKWNEITAELSPGQSPQDRPDVVTRVFNLKKDQLIKDICKDGIFGEALAHLWVVEFQKRGLPHVHIIIFLAEEDRPRTAEKVDGIVTAELPPNPSERGITQEEKVRRKRLWDIVVTNMIHGPCGQLDKDAQCMEDGKCTKKFPKHFKERTIVDPDTTHPVYRRRSPQMGGGGVPFKKINAKLMKNVGLLLTMYFLPSGTGVIST
jgi:hypothetical protein